MTDLDEQIRRAEQYLKNVSSSPIPQGNSISDKGARAKFVLNQQQNKNQLVTEAREKLNSLLEERESQIILNPEEPMPEQNNTNTQKLIIAAIILGVLTL